MKIVQFDVTFDHDEHSLPDPISYNDKYQRIDEYYLGEIAFRDGTLDVILPLEVHLFEMFVRKPLDWAMSVTLNENKNVFRNYHEVRTCFQCNEKGYDAVSKLPEQGVIRELVTQEALRWAKKNVSLPISNNKLFCFYPYLNSPGRKISRKVKHDTAREKWRCDCPLHGFYDVVLETDEGPDPD